MASPFLQDIFATWIAPRIEKPIRNSAIHAAKAYIKTLRAARSGVIGIFMLGAAASLIVTGISMMLIGALSLLPLNTEAVWITLIVIGFLSTVIPTVLVLRFFSVRNWLDAGRANELVEIVTSPWENMIPSDPIADQEMPRDSSVEFGNEVPTASTIADEFNAVADPLGTVPNGYLPLIP